MGKHSNSRAPRRPARPRGALAALAVLALSFGTLLGAAGARIGLLAEAPTPTPLETTPPHPTTSPAPAAPRSCSVNALTLAADALDFHAIVARADTGEVLLQRQHTEPTPSASVMKLVTAATALTVLGGDTRLPTRVVEGDAPGSVVLVGGGDVTLRSQTASFYATAASTADLAAQLAGRGITRVGFDDALFTGAQWQPSWEESDRVDGSTAPVSALMVDAGRADPTLKFSPRSTSPSQDAAASFATDLGATVDPAVHAKPGAEPIAEVWSPSVRELVGIMLLESDNVIAESLARLVAIKLGTGSDFAAVDAAQRLALGNLGITTDGFAGADGSGLSRDNRVTAQLLLELLQQISADAAGLGTLRGALPQNMVSGTLDDRLAGVPPGQIQAKTGFTNQVYALAGFMQPAAGDELLFAVFVTVPDPTTDATITSLANRDALDAAVAQMFACGASLRDG